MDSPDFKEALKDPKSVRVDELDALLEAQLQAVQLIKKMTSKEVEPKKSKKIRTSSSVSRKLKQLNNRI